MTLKSQLFILSLSIGIFIIILFDLIFYHTVKNTLRDQIYHHLESVSELQRDRIQRLISNNKERLTFVANRPFLTRNVSQYLSSKNIEKQSLLYLSLKNTSEGVESFKDLYIADLNGSVFASSDTASLGQDFSHLNGFKVALKGQYCVDGVHLRGNNDIGLFLTAPLFFENKLVAVLIIDSYGENFEKTIQDYTGLGKTGETTLSKKLPTGEVLFITPLRFDTAAALRKKVTPDSNPEMKKTIFSGEGLHEGLLDYRGERVIAVKKHIPETKWNIITKIDEEEAMKPIIQTRNLLLIISFFAGIIVVAVTWIFGNYLTRPLKTLTEYAQKLKEENYRERIHGCPNNEIKILGESYNQLADQLERSRIEVQKTLKQLHESNEALNNFAYTVSHDLKSPLASIEGLVKLLEMDDSVRDSPQKKQILSMITGKVKLMGEMIARVLEYAQTGSSGTLEKTNINSYEIIREVIFNLSPPENFHFIIQTDLPIISYSKIPFIQIIQNLISNSIKYMDKTEGIVKISCQEKSEHWQFCVADNGRGIEEKYFNKIFMMLKKVTKENIESTGIGLATVKKIVTENGGEVRVKSKVGKGAVFSFTIPKDKNSIS